MSTPQTPDHTAAPSVTIAIRHHDAISTVFVVTLADRKTVRAYPCRSAAAATALAARFLASVIQAPA